MTKTIPRIALFLAFSAAILVITTRPSSADEPPAAAPAAAAPAPLPRSCSSGRPRRSARSTNAELTARLADVEAYVTNGQPKAPTLATTSGPGHNAWMMTSAALVLFMTLPGLALFYGGLVRRKNILSVMAQCLGCAGMVTFLWWLVGYSFVFGRAARSERSSASTKFAFLKGVDAAPNGDYAYWVSQNVFSMYQLMFAIITPALIVGAIAERMKYSAIMAFIVLWMFVVYFPLAHMVWGVDGMMNGVWNAKAARSRRSTSPAARSSTCRPAGRRSCSA